MGFLKQETDGRSVKVVAHRGVPGLAVENTAESFREAVKAGADVLETDIRLTRDGHLLLSHDSTLERLGGTSDAVCTLTRREIESLQLYQGGFSARPLFMDEALQAFPKQDFHVDLKDPGYPIVEKWCRLLDESCSGGRCLTASFLEKNLRIFRSINATSPVSVSKTGVYRLLLGSLAGYCRSPDRQEGIIHIPEYYMGLQIINRNRLCLWQRGGWKVMVWTVDDEKDMRRLVEWGIDGIITNLPGLARSVIARFNKKD